MEKRLEEKIGTGFASVMFGEGRVYATETFHQHKAVLPDAGAELLLANIVDGLRAIGGGYSSLGRYLTASITLVIRVLAASLTRLISVLEEALPSSILQIAESIECSKQLERTSENLIYL